MLTNINRRMCTFCLFVLFVIFQNARSTIKHYDDDDDDTVRVLTDFFVRRHVHTVTANTCCRLCDINEKLFKSLSANDISVSFRSFAQQAAIQDSTWYRHAFFVDLSCEKPTTIFQRVSDDRLFNTQNDWILLRRQRPIANGTNTTSFAWKLFETYLGNAYVLPDSRVFLFAQDVGTDVWEIWTGFRASASDTIRVFKIGSVSRRRFDVNDSWNEERRRFRGITLRANTVIVDREQFFGFNARISSDLDVFSHMHYAMIDILSDQLDFKVALGVNAEYGWSFGNGTFGGLMGALQNNEIDLSAAGVLIRADRMAVVDYTISTMPFRTTVLFRQPQLSSVYNILLLPFTFELWLTVLAIFITFVFVLVLLTRANYKLTGNRKSSLDVQDVLILVHGAICQQGASYKLKLESVRLVVFVLFLTSVFVYTSYSASIASLIQSNSNSIKSIRDIVESPMTFSAQTSPYGKYYFEETEDPLIKQLYETKMIPTGNKGFSKAPDGIERTRTEFHGFMSEVISAYKIIGKEWREEEKCGLAEIQLFRFPPLSIPLVKKSGHRDLFKQKLIQQMEIGLSKRIVDQWITSKPSCGASGRAKVYVSVSMTEIYLTLKIIGCGACVSLGILAIEVVYRYWTNRNGDCIERK